MGRRPVSSRPAPPVSTLYSDAAWLKQATPRQRVRYARQRTAQYGERLYRETEQNPLVPWMAWQDARAAGVLPAPWVLAYLDQVAGQFTVLSRFANVPTRDRIAHAIAAACGFRLSRSPRSNPFRQLNAALHQIVVAGEVNLTRLRTGLDRAYDEVADEHPARCQQVLGPVHGCARIDRRTVQRYFLKYRHLFTPARRRPAKPSHS